MLLLWSADVMLMMMTGVLTVRSINKDNGDVRMQIFFVQAYTSRVLLVIVQA